MMAVGAKVPDVRAKLADGSNFSLHEALGKHAIVLYFYPKDFTPGCTKQACSFRDHRDEIQKMGAEIYGVSLDSAEQHGSFAEKHSLPFPLTTRTSPAPSIVPAWAQAPPSSESTVPFRPKRAPHKTTRPTPADLPSPAPFGSSPPLGTLDHYREAQLVLCPKRIDLDACIEHRQSLGQQLDA